MGAAFEYSNLNYTTLGLVVEIASGEPFDQALAATRDYNLPMVTQMPGSGPATGPQTGKPAPSPRSSYSTAKTGSRAAEAGMERMRPLVAPLRVQFDSVENLEVFASQTTTHTA